MRGNLKFCPLPQSMDLIKKIDSRGPSGTFCWADFESQVWKFVIIPKSAGMFLYTRRMAFDELVGRKNTEFTPRKVSGLLSAAYMSANSTPYDQQRKLYFDSWV